MMNPVLSRHLEEHCGCRVAAVSNSLANRPLLRKDIHRCLQENEVDTLMTEVKAAGIDVAARLGLEHGLKVVFMDNILTTVGGDGDLNQLVRDVARKAVDRFSSPPPLGCAQDRQAQDTARKSSPEAQ
jgi:predicted GTPase